MQNTIQRFIKEKRAQGYTDEDIYQTIDIMLFSIIELSTKKFTQSDQSAVEQLKNILKDKDRHVELDEYKKLAESIQDENGNNLWEFMEENMHLFISKLDAKDEE